MSLQDNLNAEAEFIASIVAGERKGMCKQCGNFKAKAKGLCDTCRASYRISETVEAMRADRRDDITKPDTNAFTINGVPHVLCGECIDWLYVQTCADAHSIYESVEPCEMCGETPTTYSFPPRTLTF